MQRSWKKLQRMHKEDYGVGSTTKQKKNHKRQLKHILRSRINKFFKA